MFLSEKDKSKKFKFRIVHRCPVLMTENSTVVYADSEDEALERIQKTRSSIISIEKKDVSHVSED